MDHMAIHDEQYSGIDLNKAEEKTMAIRSSIHSPTHALTRALALALTGKPRSFTHSSHLFDAPFLQPNSPFISMA